jgi:hypothetical protein
MQPSATRGINPQRYTLLQATTSSNRAFAKIPSAIRSLDIVTTSRVPPIQTVPIFLLEVNKDSMESKEKNNMRMPITQLIF